MSLFKSTRSYSPKIAIIDDLFPHPLCMNNWRGTEFGAYLDYFPLLFIYATLWSRVLVDSTPIESIMKQYADSAPSEWVKRTKYVYDFENKSIKKPDLFYFIFLNNVYLSLNTIDRYKKPFLFTLYPGGGFALDNEESDKKLRAVVSNKNFRGVLTTSNVTYRYLIDNGYCKENQILPVWGGVFKETYLKTEQYKKDRFGFGKETFDIVFTASRYTEKGQDKGYDIFVELAKRLAQESSLFRFHVVGNFDASVIDVSELDKSITFYGLQDASFFDSFYRDKDLFISPNRPNVLTKGAFDGFPTGCAVDAIVRKTAAFCTDLTASPQNMGQYISGKEIEIIGLDCAKIVDKVMHFYNHPNDLAELGDSGAKKARELYCAKNQILPRIQWLEDHLWRENRRLG